MTDRRHFLFASGAALVGLAKVAASQAAQIPESPLAQAAATSVPPPPPNGHPFNPVITLNGWSLPWRMKSGWKEFHLVAEPVEREIAPGMTARLWGYNGQSPGPTIEVVEGDRVRLFVTNKLPEDTTIHWHGQILPNGMDGVTGLNQPPIKPGETWVYEFEAKHAGTYMYHPHADDMLQMAMGMMGSWITHPRDPSQHRVDRDYVFLLNAYDIDPGSYTPKVNTMLDFNLWTWNSRAFPGIAPLLAQRGERVRIRSGNLTMTNHPLHLHGHVIEVAGTDGGWIHPAARWPEVTVDIAPGQMRAIEFTASELGDWAFHCHKLHHTMGPMGHSVPTMIGVDQRKAAEKINHLIPDYMAMGSEGMADMGEMHMPLPENTLPMMDGQGPYGALGMGGMVSVLKVRERLHKDPATHDYRDPGWYEQPKGTQARPWQGDTPPPTRARGSGAAKGGATVNVVRPGGEHGNHGGHEGHEH
jgi:FtsP/CotA-like multicopper oxidase with cupredoxin domain